MRLGILTTGFEPPIQQPQPVEKPLIVRRKRQEEQDPQKAPLPFPLPLRKKSRARLALSLFAIMQFRRQAIPRSAQELLLQRESLDAVQTLRRLLLQCRDADVSQQPAWLDGLHLCWKRCQILLMRAQSHGCDWLSEPLRHVLALIASHGGEDEGNLGSYLDKGAGHAWYPLPFLVLLRGLHIQSRDSGEHGVLGNWLRLLSDLLQIWKLQPLRGIQASAPKVRLIIPS